MTENSQSPFKTKLLQSRWWHCLGLFSLDGALLLAGGAEVSHSLQRGFENQASGKLSRTAK